MKIQIKSISGAVIYESDSGAVREAIREANLYGASLSRASLAGANLSGANLNWKSHDIIAELLRRWAIDDIEKRMLAGLILVSRDWCWREFLAIDHKFKAEAIAELKRWLKPGTNLPME